MEVVSVMADLILLSDWQKSQYEFWLPIPNFPGYDVSNFGRVRSYWKHKQRWMRGCTMELQQTPVRILKPNVDAFGYPSHSIKAASGKRYTVKAHRLVALTFLPNESAMSDVNHRNAIKIDARLENLEWCTPAQNREHAKRNGLVSRGANHYNAKVTPQTVREIRELYRFGMRRQQIADLFGITRSQVRDITLYRTWRSVE
jgi:hypothetical protein